MERLLTTNRDAGGGGAGGACAPQVLGYQLTLFGPRGADYPRHITTCPPIFSEDAASLDSNQLFTRGKSRKVSLPCVTVGE